MSRSPLRIAGLARHATLPPHPSILRARVARAVLAVALFGVAACGGDTAAPKAVASVDLSPSSLTIAPGQSSALVATPREANGSPLTGRTLTWTTSNASVATVSSAGVVTGVADGVASITASAGTAAGSASVVVRTPVASVVMNPTTANLIVGGAPLQLTASPRSASGATLDGRTVTWATSSAAIATVSPSGLVTAVGPGTANITATSDNVVGTAAITVSVNPCALVRPLNLGTPVSGTLQASDCKLADSTALQRYQFTLTQRTKIELTMTSAAVDAYLFLLDSARNVIDEDDDGAGNRNARILRTLPAGRYEVLANVFDAGTFGAYQLSLAPAPAVCTVGRAVTLPSNLAATLSTSACRTNDQAYEDRYDFTVVTRGIYRVEMRSAQVDAFAVLLDENERIIIQDDDSGFGNDAAMEAVLEPGRYTVLARGYPRQTGTYELAIGAAVDPCAVNRTIAVGQAATGTFSSADCALSDGGGPERYLQRYGFTLTNAANVQIDMTSNEVDTYLILQNAQTGAIVAENDDLLTGGSTNSRITLALQPGVYVINSTTYGTGEVGTYRLAVTLAVASNIGISVTPTTLALSAGQTARVTATVTNTGNPTVIWSTDAPNVATVAAEGTVRGITPGTARITATSVVDPTRSATTTVTVSPAGSPNLDIASLYIVQAVQQPDGRVPLVSNRQAMVRAFVRTSGAGTQNVQVRVRIYRAGNVIGTYTGTATPTATVDESCCSAYILLPAAMIARDNAILADVDPTNNLAEPNENDNTWPLSGTPQVMNVVDVPPFNVRFVPVRQTRNGLTGQMANTLLTTFSQVWPLSAINVSVRAPLSIDYTLGAQNFDDWGRLVRDIELLRQAEGGAEYYYGLVRSTARSGVLGLANGIPARAAIGVDEGSDFGATEARLTFAHEMGHTLGLRHAPCGGAAGPDPQYPFADGRTGVWGVDIPANLLRPPTSSDIMSYCPNQWVSAYNYRKVLDFRFVNPFGAGVGYAPVLMVSGAVARGTVTLDPAFSLTARPAPRTPDGRYVAEGFDAEGRTLFSWRFDPYKVEDLRDDHEAFVIAVPVSEAVQARITRLVVREVNGVRRATRTSSAASLGAAGDMLTLQRSSGAKASVTFTPAEVPALMVRDRITGTVLAIARQGALDLSALGSLDRLDLIASDGTRSAKVRYDAGTGRLRK